MLPSGEESDRFLALSLFSGLGQNSRKVMFCYVVNNRFLDRGSETGQSVNPPSKQSRKLVSDRMALLLAQLFYLTHAHFQWGRKVCAA